MSILFQAGKYYLGSSILPSVIGMVQAYVARRQSATDCPPHAEFLAWHRAEVFKEPARA
jgi:hypothetical protein